MSISRILADYTKEKLLTHEEEIELGSYVQAMVSAPNPISGITKKGNWAREKLVKANMRLVISIAKKYQNKGVEFDVLIQEGSIGLNRATLKYDPAKGYRFSTYAYWWVRQAISRHIPKNLTITAPVYLVALRGKAAEEQHRLRSGLGRKPTVDELALSLDCDIALLERALAIPSCMISLDAPVRAGNESALIDILDADHSTHDKDWQSAELSYAIDQLSAMHRKAIRLLFFEERTIVETAEIMQVGEKTVQSLKKEALEKMRGLLGEC